MLEEYARKGFLDSLPRQMRLLVEFAPPDLPCLSIGEVIETVDRCDRAVESTGKKGI